MTEKSRFFNSTPTDERKYDAGEFAEYFNQFLSNGVFHEDLVPELKVDSAGTDMQVYVEPGSAWVEGYMYINDANLYLTHDTAEATDDRIDRVVLRLDLTTEYRNIRAYIKKGTPASPGNAEPPALTRDDWQYELSLAQVLIPADTGTIDPNNITDERENEEVCGLVASLLSPDVDAPTQAEFDAHLSDNVQQTNEEQEDIPHGLAKCNYNATEHPTENNDETEGYSRGSKWFVEIEEDGEYDWFAYVCLDASEGAAVWEKYAEDLNIVLGHGSLETEAENPDGKYYGTIEVNDGTKEEENIETHFYKITGGSEGEPEAGYEDFNGANLLHYFGIASDDTWTGQNSNEPWVKYEWQRKYGSQFTDEPKICFIPKKSIAQGGNWEDLYLAGVVYGDDLKAGEEGAEHHNTDSSDDGVGTLEATRQDKWIEIDGIGYRIRLLEGGDVDTEADKEDAYGDNEWNTILYSLVNCNDDGHLGEAWANKDAGRDVADYKWENWNDAEANVGGDGGDGRRDWCQETEDGGDSDRRVNRGPHRVSSFIALVSAATHSDNGFRPVLQLMD